jgi:hypothetical protein
MVVDVCKTGDANSNIKMVALTNMRKGDRFPSTTPFGNVRSTCAP